MLNPQEDDPMKDLLPQTDKNIKANISVLGVNYNSGEIYMFIHTFCSLHCKRSEFTVKYDSVSCE